MLYEPPFLYACKEADGLKLTTSMNPIFLQLKDLMTARTKLLNQINSITVFLSELSGSNSKEVQKELKKMHQAALTGLIKSKLQIEENLKEIVHQNSAIKKNYLLIKTVPGIGHLTAIYLICCTFNFSVKISGKQLACYAGLAPFQNTSGTSIKSKNRVHKMGNKDLKKLLHLCALAAIKKSNEIKRYYERKKIEGKHGLCVINAIKNKLVHRIVSVVNNRSCK